MRQAQWVLFFWPVLIVASGCATPVATGPIGEAGAWVPTRLTGASGTTTTTTTFGEHAEVLSLLTQPAAGTQPGSAEAAAAAAAGGAAPSANRVALAKELTNPISDLIRVPVQFNYDEGFGPAGAARYSVSVQPVFPIRLSEDLTLITRTNVPLVYREAPVATGEDAFGLGDISQSLFFCPQGRRWIWGIGPLFVFPTASEELLAGKKWGAGPNVIGVVLDDHWTYGVVATHLWSFAGSDSRPDVSVTSLSGFLAYTTTNAYTLALQTDSLYNWKDNHWTIPIELQASKVTRFGRNLVSVGVGGRYYIDSPEGGPEWGVRVFVTFLFPR